MGGREKKRANALLRAGPGVAEDADGERGEVGVGWGGEREGGGERESVCIF